MASIKKAAHLGPNDRLDPDDHDANLVEFWLRKDPTRWIAGAIAGVVAAWIALGFASLFSAAVGLEPLFAVKVMGLPLMGASATEVGMNVPAIVSGIVFMSVLGAFWGFVFSHFVFTNHVPSLLAMGAVWGTFSWIFLWNLFFQSIRSLHFMAIPPGAVFPVCMVFGISLVCVSFFDKLLRR